MGDQSFRALVISLVVHAILAVILLRMPSQSETDFLNQPIEVQVMDSSRKPKLIVTETEKDLSPLEKLEKEADLLSALTKRVKEQSIARRIGETKNRPGNAPVETEEQRAEGAPGIGADAQTGRSLNLPGVGPGARGGEGASPFGRQVVVGESTAGEIIPGIKIGAFTALNTDRFTYYTFFARINEQLRPRWTNNLRNFSQSIPRERLVELASRDRTTEFDIQLNREGHFLRAVVLRSSGNRDLDATFSDAFENAAPFLNAPTGLVAEDGLIHLHYIVTVQAQPHQTTVGR